MPSKNSIKEYIEGGFYHVYNRGVNKQQIFLCTEDYDSFINIIEKLLVWPKDKKSRLYGRFKGRIDIYSFCLMPTHFHFYLLQCAKYDMTDFMRALGTMYVSYFNKKYARVGPLFQGRYRAKLILDENYSQIVMKYIHDNPKDIVRDVSAYRYSSLCCYLGVGGVNYKFVNTARFSYFPDSDFGGIYDDFNLF